jgi:CheY-like chemotaxis protein
MLAVRARGDRLRIEVWDTGCGIEPRQIERVFEEFYRGPAAAEAAPGRGFGLGLAITERIARVLGHAVGVRSRPGRGSVFWIEVPVAAPAAPAAAAPEARPAGTLAGVRALCVDNDAAALRGLVALLEAWGCEALPCAGLDDAALALRRHGPRLDVLLVDYHLDGGVSGLDLIEALRRDEACTAPAVVVSADASEQVRAQAEAQGCIFLRKPLKPLQLRSALRRALGEQAG